MAAKTTVQSKVDPQLLERLDALAERIGWTRSETIEHCIAHGVKEGERFADRLSTPVLGHFMKMVAAMDMDDPDELKRFDAMWDSVRQEKAKTRGQQTA